MWGRVTGLAGVAVVLLAAPGAHAAETTITFDQGQIKFGGSPLPSTIVEPGQPVTMRTNVDVGLGFFEVDPEDFDFPPVTTQIGPGQQATVDLIPATEIRGEYDQESGGLDLEGINFTFRADLATGGTCETEIWTFLSTGPSDVFDGEAFDQWSVPPRNGAIAGDWPFLSPAAGAQCAVFNHFIEGEGGIRFANSSSGPEGGALSAKPKRNHLAYGDTVKIEGRLSGVPSGVAGHRVELIERRYPYDEPSPQTQAATTDADGSYAFKVRPEMNARYVVRDSSGSGASSKPVAIWVWEKGDVDVHVVGAAQVRANWTLKFSPDLPTDYTNRKMFWYFKKAGSPRLTLKKRTRIKQTPGQIRSEVKFSIPRRGRYRFYAIPCFDEPKDDDGTGKPGRYKCPRKKHSTIRDFRN